MVFGACGDPSYPWVVFTKGVLRICGDPRRSRKVCSISLTNGEITDNKDGDGQKHTLTIDYKSERTAPTAGTLNVGTVTENSIALSWTHASDNITPKNKLYYVVEYKMTDESGWAMHYIGNATSYNITGLKPDTEYQVQLRVLDESGNYTRYSKQTVTTKAEAYALKIGGVDVTPANCNDLSVIPGVSGSATYDPATRTIKLKDAKITTGMTVLEVEKDEYTGERYTIELAGKTR